MIKDDGRNMGRNHWRERERERLQHLYTNM
jgi:hypothetical protein